MRNRMSVPAWIVRSCHIQFPVSQPAWHSPRCDRGHHGWRAPLTCWFSLQLNPVLAAVIIPVLNNNTSLVNTGLWGFVFVFFDLWTHCFHGTTRLNASSRAWWLPFTPSTVWLTGCWDLTGLGKEAVKTSQLLHFCCCLLGASLIWECLAFLGIKCTVPVSDLSHVPGVRAAGPEEGAHVVVVDLCRSSGGKIVRC